MRLYLSSMDIGNYSERLVQLVGNNKKAAIILNALDHAIAGRNKWLRKNSENLGKLGFIVEELDLRQYFKNNSSLEKKLSEYGLIWVNGGNVFILQRAFEQSGFNTLLKQYLAEDKLVYGGFSAALYVISPSLKGAELVDDPKIVPEEYEEDFSWEALNLIPYCVAVHYQSDHEESEDMEKEIEYYKKNNIPYKTLRDGEVIVINGAMEEFLTL
jgi:dipeptidase E